MIDTELLVMTIVIVWQQESSTIAMVIIFHKTSHITTMVVEKLPKKFIVAFFVVHLKAAMLAQVKTSAVR